MAKKPSSDMYSRINNLVNNEVKSEMDRIREELEQTRRELLKSAEEMKRDAEKVRNDIRNQLVQKQIGVKPPSTGMRSKPNPPFDRNLYDDYSSYATNYNKNQWITDSTKKKNLGVVDKTVTENDITKYTPATHKVKITTKVTSQDRENGTRKIIGMETVDWWEYVLIYGFFKATKIAYQYNIVKHLLKNPEHIVSLVNKVAVVLSFIPVNDVKEKIDKFEGKEFTLRTGIKYREFQLPIEIPYKTGMRTEEVKKGFFLYEEKYETLEPDYEALGKKIAQELDDKKINENFKQIIANEINNGRISRV